MKKNFFLGLIFLSFLLACNYAMNTNPDFLNASSLYATNTDAVSDETTVPFGSEEDKNSEDTETTTTAVPGFNNGKPVGNGAEYPEEYAEHVLMEGKNTGYCEELTGKLHLVAVFLNDSASAWDEKTMADIKNELISELGVIESEADGYGAQVDITHEFKEITITCEAAAAGFDDKQWVEEASKVLSGTNIDNYQAALEANWGCDNAPVVFIVNKAGRAFAHNYTVGSGGEYAIIYSSDFDAFRHELYHLFGARDLYLSDEISSTAEKYFPDSIMGSEGTEMDDFNAYMVGWTNELTGNTRALLDETANITDEYLERVMESDSITGKGTKEFPAGIYTGEMLRGTPDGEGTMKFFDGDIYNGSWSGGERNGKGVYTWVNGDRYEGDFKSNEATGKGTYTWSSGDKYEGDFLKGARTGKGTYTWTNGDKYEGDFLDGAFHGEGKLTYATGNIKQGIWEKGEYIQ